MVVVVAGVAGSGKTTVGQLLAARMGWTFADGDSFHPAANVAKMRAGVPLTDEDRRPWLAALTSWMDDTIRTGQSAVLACSALRRRYRDQLLTGRPQAVIAFLTISMKQDEGRLARRTGHFFSEPLLASQFAALEPPEPSEDRVYPIPTTDGSPGQIVTAIITALHLADVGGAGFARGG